MSYTMRCEKKKLAFANSPSKLHWEVLKQVWGEAAVMNEVKKWLNG